MARKRSNIIAINDLRTSDTLDAKRFEGRYNRLSDLLVEILEDAFPTKSENSK